MERAELLCDDNDGKRRSWIVLSLLVGVVAPMVAVVPFLFALEKDGEDDPSRDGLMVSSVWMGTVQGYVEMICCFDRFTISLMLVLQFSCGINATRDESCVCKDSGRRAYVVCVCCDICNRGVAFFLIKTFG